MVHDNLVSSHIEERVDAARNLGQLHCGDAMVLFALKERLEKDEELRVKYEAAKSLILLGTALWENSYFNADVLLKISCKFEYLGQQQVVGVNNISFSNLSASQIV